MRDSSNQAKSIFLAATEGYAPEQWPAFLDQACGADAALRARVEHLLRAWSAMGSFHELVEDTIDQPRREGPGTVIGRYKLLQQIGEGGMGTVYMAEQTQSVQRKVALKIVKPGMDSGQIIARFEAERQALAMMDHANIARVLDVGATEAGRPFFVMELVHGVSITKYCDDSRLTPRARLELFVPVCQAIHHAHQKGIIHRDIKPSNVMITLCDGRPVPKVIDFGVAKATEQRLTERTLFTQYGAMVGTPEYMSPEQAEMSAMGVDTRSDIYSLGVLLYQLLAGSTPLINKRVREAGFSEILRMIKEEEPPRPSTRLSESGDALASIAAQRQTEPSKLAMLLRGEVDWIVMKCLEKDRTRRYESAAALAHDVQRHLADEPVEACPPSAAYRASKFARKNKAALIVGAAFILLLVAGLAVSAWQTVRAIRAEGQMQTERDKAQMALTLQVAERLDGEMRQLAVFGSSIEAALASQPAWREDQLQGFLTDLLRNDDRIHGLTLAYEENQSPTKKKDYCLYVYRSLADQDRKKILTTHLLPDSGYKLYRTWPWYRTPFDSGRAQWTGPTFDGAPEEEVWMVGYSVPMQQNGKKVGVVTVDLQVKYFTTYRNWLDELNLGKKSYGIVVHREAVVDGKGTNQAGVFVSHPLHGAGDLRREPPRKLTDLGRSDPAFVDLTDHILKGKTDQGTVNDPETGRRSIFLFAPVASTPWSFVVVIEE